MNINRNTCTTSLLLSNTQVVLNEVRLVRGRFNKEVPAPGDSRKRLLQIPHHNNYKELSQGRTRKSSTDTIPYSNDSIMTPKHDTPPGSLLSQKQHTDSFTHHETPRLRRLTFISGNRLTGRCAAPRTTQRSNKNISNENINVASSRETRTRRTHTSTKDVENQHEVPDDVSLILKELKHIKNKIASEIEMKREMNNGLENRIQSFMNACDMVLESFVEEELVGHKRTRWCRSTTTGRSTKKHKRATDIERKK